MMNMINEMMKKMDADIKKQGMDMMNQCQEMMDKMPPDMKQQCMPMMDRCKNMMGDSTADAEQNDATDNNLVFTHKATGNFEEIESRVEEDAKETSLVSCRVSKVVSIFSVAIILITCLQMSILPQLVQIQSRR